MSGLRLAGLTLILAGGGGHVDGRGPLDDAALARRVEEYADTRKGAARAAEDARATDAARRFVAALAAADGRLMLAESSLPWADHADLIRERPALGRHLATYRLPAAFARGEQRVTLLAGLEDLECALGKKVPEAARKVWAAHLAGGSRVAAVRGGPMLLGLSLRPVKGGYAVSGLLFDYFPKPDDPLLRAIAKAPTGAR